MPPSSTTRGALGSVSGVVFDIQRFSVHDGPGIRTTVFFKGCPLRCSWCTNPESQEALPQLVFWPDRCMACEACVAACPRGAIEATADTGHQRRILADRCDLCGRCLDTCFPGALERVGMVQTAAETVAAVAEDRLFYDLSGGGVTLSGGEPTAQPRFARAVLQGCRDAGIDTAIETCGSGPWREWTALLPHVDLVLLDLKEIDPVRHRELTGVSNRIILANARRLAAQGVPLIVRRPLIPGHNDSLASLHALGRFVRELDTVRQVDLLPYHRMGSAKYARLGRHYSLGDRPSLSPEEAEPARRVLLSYGLWVNIGG